MKLEDILGVIASWVEKKRDNFPPKSLWFECKSIKLYLRCGLWYHPEKIERVTLRTLTIATVSVPEEKQRKGIFKQTLCFLENLARELEIPLIQVENVHNPILRDYLLRRGYKIARYANYIYLDLEGGKNGSDR